MKRALAWIREVEWLSVFCVALVVVAVIVGITGPIAVAIVLGLASIALAVLSLRSE